MAGRVADEGISETMMSDDGLALELTGGMPCVRCGYDLRGLSVRNVCPECGTPIRATILARVDPRARELQPVHTPRLTAGLLVLWATAALGAAVVAWVPRVVEALNRMEYVIEPPRWAMLVVILLVGVSMIGAGGLIRPQRGLPIRGQALAALAVLLYVPLLQVIANVYHPYDIRDPSPYLGVGGIDPQRAAWRLGMDALLILILLCLRPNARALAARSFVLRTGRVDRQTILAMVAAVGVCAIGDLLAVVGGSLGTSGPEGAAADVMRVAALLFVGVGSLLVTLGLAGVVLDVLRLVPVVVEPPLSLADVTRVVGGFGASPASRGVGAAGRGAGDDRPAGGPTP